MSRSGFDVVVVGNVGIDTNVYGLGDGIDFRAESSFTENIDYVGQAGGYTCRGYAQLGKRTAFIGYVGDDHNGDFVRKEFARDGVDTTALLVDTQGTSRSSNLMLQGGRRKNFYDGKDHLHLQPDLEIRKQVLAGARLAHFHIPNWARMLLPVARDLGLTIACDLQDVLSADDDYRRDFVEHADILFFSAVNQPDPQGLIEVYLRARPGQIVIAGMGAEGCAVGSPDGVRRFPAVEMDLPVVDTTGAGDGLAVGFLSSFVLDNYALSHATLRGQITARYTCAQKASSSSLITAEKLEHCFQANLNQS